MREALKVATPALPPTDPRVLEIKTYLVTALDALGRGDEARAMRAEIEPALKASSSPYAAELLEELGASSSAATRVQR